MSTKKRSKKIPGWFANDGNCEVHYPDARGGLAAATRYVKEGDWNEPTRTLHISVRVWRRWDTGTVVAGSEDRHIVSLDPPEPACSEGEHDWELGQVYGSGGGVKWTDTCTRCGLERSMNTWDSEAGVEGLTTIRYR